MDLKKKKQILLDELKSFGFSKNVIGAFSKVKRENFIPGNLKHLAYKDTALPLGFGQTISQPYTIAIMLDELNIRKGQRVIEVGSGCGYVLALLSELVGKKGKVYGMEIVKSLFEKSKRNLKDYENVEVYNQDGTKGLKEKAVSHEQKLKGGFDKGKLGSLYFDRVLISARTEKIPKELILQLKENGMLVAPIGNNIKQDLVVYEKKNGKLKIKKKIEGFMFVPLVG
ncbi:protein-L-isoaspartate O-methyltransferase [Candidatus Pacearchaeota archaeon CG10_big_fil_rev_8_21_14_0_10_34_12]|nr:MAG: protein-L-isoaspartate O-methyltransferase [Candidatus Pacearchaeota archaeon CG10_big_fil_rev_8_21_14_0_10_34_12]